MCFSQPKMPAMPPPPAPTPLPAKPPPPLAMAKKAPTKRATQPTKRSRGTAQVTARRRPSIGMGGSGGTGVQFSS
jgi:hypothetical protein